jgi:hypothetical protein
MRTSSLCSFTRQRAQAQLHERCSGATARRLSRRESLSVELAGDARPPGSSSVSLDVLVCLHGTLSPLFYRGFIVGSRELACEVPGAA